MNKITRKSEVKPLSAGQMFNVNDKLFALIEKNVTFPDTFDYFVDLITGSIEQGSIRAMPSIKAEIRFSSVWRSLVKNTALTPGQAYIHDGLLFLRTLASYTNVHHYCDYCIDNGKMMFSFGPHHVRPVDLEFVLE